MLSLIRLVIDNGLCGHRQRCNPPNMGVGVTTDLDVEFVSPRPKRPELEPQDKTEPDSVTKTVKSMPAYAFTTHPFSLSSARGGAPSNQHSDNFLVSLFVLEVVARSTIGILISRGIHSISSSKDDSWSRLLGLAILALSDKCFRSALSNPMIAPSFLLNKHPVTEFVKCAIQ